MAEREEAVKKEKVKKPKRKYIKTQKKVLKEQEKQLRRQLSRQKKNIDEQNAQSRKKLRKAAAPRNTAQAIAYRSMYEDGICEVEAGLFSKSVRFADINYQTARRDDQIDIFTRYCECLNYFPEIVWVQITLINRQIDDDAFRREMFMQMADDELDAYRQEMNQMLTDKIQEGQNGITRERFLTFAIAADNYKAAVPQLARIETDCIGLLKGLGCEPVTALSGTERLQVLHSITRPGEKFKFDYADLICSGLTTKSTIAPVSLDFTPKKHFGMGDYEAQVLHIHGLPSDLSDKLVSDLIDLPVNMVFALHIQNIRQDKALNLVDGRIAMMEMEQNNQAQKALSKGLYPEMLQLPETKRALGQAQELAGDLRERNQRMFKVTPLIYTYAKDEKALADHVFQMKTVAQKLSVTIDDIAYAQREAFNSILPLGKNHLPNRQRHLTTASTAIFVPFATQELMQPNGMYYGQNAISRNLVMFNRKSLAAPNGFVLGKPGAGKSFASKREIANVLLANPNDEVIIIDPEREYGMLADGFGGEIVHISASSTAHINPLDITDNYADDGDPVSLKSEFMLSLCELICGIGTGQEAAKQKTIIDRACKLAYEPYFSSRSKTMPTMPDFYNILMQQPEPEAKSLAVSLELYIKGSLSTFANPTNVDISKRLVVYDVKDLGKQLRTMGMLIVLDQIWNRITLNRALGKRTWLYIDEIQLLFTNDYSANYFFELWSRARKWGAIPTGITQNVETLLLSDLARRMLSNSDYIMLLNQATSDQIELAALLNISETQLRHVTNTDPGNGLLIANGSIVPFIDEFPRNTQLYRMMTTKIEEVSDISKVG